MSGSQCDMQMQPSTHFKLPTRWGRLTQRTFRMRRWPVWQLWSDVRSSSVDFFRGGHPSAAGRRGDADQQIGRDCTAVHQGRSDVALGACGVCDRGCAPDSAAHRPCAPQATSGSEKCPEKCPLHVRMQRGRAAQAQVRRRLASRNAATRRVRGWGPAPPSGTRVGDKCEKAGAATGAGVHHEIARRLGNARKRARMCARAGNAQPRSR
jgi:hypothetical protein